MSKDLFINLNGEEVFKPDEAAKFLKVGRSTFDKWLATGDIEYSKIGSGKNSSVRILKSSLVQFIKRQCAEAQIA